MRALILFVLLSLSTSSFAIEDETLYTLGNTLLLADWSQTRYIIRNKDDGYYETNYILGRHPSKENVDLYFTSLMVAYNVIGRKYIDTPTKKLAWHGLLFMMQSYATNNNRMLGIQMRF